MMINTSRFSKCLIIFLVYNIMTIFTVSCDGSDTVETEKKIVPDFDLINTSEQREYAIYYFRGTRFMDQLKVRPRTFFKSVYNCDYLILPELYEDINYDAYKNKIKTESKKIFESVVKKYNEYYENVKKEEDHYVQQFEKSYTVTKKAYEEVIMYESQTSNHDQYLKKEDAIIDYLHNQMPEVSEETFPNAYWGNLRYMYKNYEVYADPTDEVYYRSNILQAEYDAVMDDDKIKTCDVILTKEEYDEVQFLYSFLSISKDYQSGFIEAKIEVFLHLQNTLPNLSKIYTKTELLEFEKLHPECDGIENADVEYTNTTTKLANEFVVNDENYMSYLVRMKIRGKIGFHLDYHKHMYKTRKNYGPILDATDIHIDNSNREVNKKSGRIQRVILPIGRYTIDMNIHLTTKQQNYAELTPFNPEDI